MSSELLAAQVTLWGNLVGHVFWNKQTQIASFEFDQSFLASPVELSPLVMPKKRKVYTFPSLRNETFKGLPGMLADSLPDKFGNALIDMWLLKQGRSSLNPVERLCYIGKRGMGALEYQPTTHRRRADSAVINIHDMVELASEILASRVQLKKRLSEDQQEKQEALTSLLAVGTSAGGARAKCIIAYNEKTGEVRSGQIKNHPDFSYWLLKLDGVTHNRDKELTDPQGYGRIEYAYFLMARDAGIIMSESKLLRENGRAHFMTKRFDRLAGGAKLHMQSLCALKHYDFNMAGAYSYEQALETIRQVVTQDNRLALEQQFRRAVFNIMGRNQDDHTKNIAFLMDKQGDWSLAPAFDITYSYNPQGAWTSRHQMCLGDKQEDFTYQDLLTFSKRADLKTRKTKEIIQAIRQVFLNWESYADEARVLPEHQQEIKKHLKLDWK